MFTTLSRSRDDVLGFAVQGRLTADDVTSMQAEVQDVVGRRGSVRLLVRMTALDTVQPSAIWQDLRMTPQYAKDVDRLAVVGTERWERLLASASDVVSDTRFFRPEEEDRAWEWLAERG